MRANDRIDKKDPVVIESNVDVKIPKIDLLAKDVAMPILI